MRTPPRTRSAPSVTGSEHAVFSKKLRTWFRKHGRDLPWRQTRDPYRILVSELMLQQTQVSRVIDKYHEFLSRFPTLQHVARAKSKSVLNAWSGLGYYARARNLHKLAQVIYTESEYQVYATTETLPRSPEALRKLPGVGAYTAGAVASFAFEQRAELVDTNVARVLKRVFAPDADLKTSAGQRRVWQLARETLPRTGKASWVHNQAVMELGALVCTARTMRCAECPVSSVCATHAVMKHGLNV